MTENNEWIDSDFKNRSMKMMFHFDMEIQRLITEAEAAGLFMSLMVMMLRLNADKLSDRLFSQSNVNGPSSRASSPSTNHRQSGPNRDV